MRSRFDFSGLVYEATEREYWAEDDSRWGKRSTTWLGFWLLAFGGRIRNAITGRPRRKAIVEKVQICKCTGSIIFPGM